MPALEIVALDTAAPQLEVPQSGDTYSAPRALAISPQSLTGASATTSLDIAQTWNTTGTPTAVKLNVTDTASNANSLLMDLGTGGGTFASKFKVDKAGAITAGTQISFNNANVSKIVYTSSYGDPNLAFYAGGAGDGVKLLLASTNNIPVAVLPANGAVAYSSNNNPLSASPDVFIHRDAANTLAQRNGDNGQIFRVYGRGGGTANFERAYIDAPTATGTAVKIGTEKAGTGTARALEFQTDGTTRATISATGEVNVAGALRIGTDANKGLITYTTNTIAFNPAGAAWFGIGNNIVDFSVWANSGITIGSTGNESGTSNRGGTPIVIRPKGGSGNGAGSYVSLFNSLPTVSGTTGHTQELTIQTWLPATGAAGIQFGGTTSAFPAIKRNGAMLETRLADDSAFAALGAEWLSITDGVTAPAAATGRARIYVDTADGDLKVIFGDGTVKTIVTDT